MQRDFQDLWECVTGEIVFNAMQDHVSGKSWRSFNSLFDVRILGKHNEFTIN